MYNLLRFIETYSKNDKRTQFIWKQRNRLDVSVRTNVNKIFPSLGGLEPPTFRLTAERANRLRHRDDTNTWR